MAGTQEVLGEMAQQQARQNFNLLFKQAVEEQFSQMAEDYYFAVMSQGGTISEASYSISLLMTGAQLRAYKRFNGGG